MSPARRVEAFDVRRPGFDDEDWTLLRHLASWRFTSARGEVRAEHPDEVKKTVAALASLWGDRGLSGNFTSEVAVVESALEWLYLLLSDVPVAPLVVSRPDDLL